MKGGGERMDSVIKRNVRIFRNSIGMSQEELANRIGVSKQMICMWEKQNNEKIPAYRYSKIAESLMIPTNYLTETNANVLALFVLNAKKNELLRQVEKIDEAREPLINYYMDLVTS